MNSTCQTFDSGRRAATVSVRMQEGVDWSTARPHVAARMILNDATFEELVGRWYESLYRFAFSLTQREADARDLTQETFRQLARKATQIRDTSKAKSWLFTTLYRAFVDARRSASRHPHVEIETAEPDLPANPAPAGEGLDAEAARKALAQVDEVYQAPLILFYLEDHSYLEIAQILGIPAGTVMSRLSRGRAMLRDLLADKPKIVPLKPLPSHAASS